MSSFAEDAHAQWLQQLATMREAIADLNLPTDTAKTPAYGHDLHVDDDDFSGTASGNDIWDMISDGYEDDYSSNPSDQFPDNQAQGNTYDQAWLAAKCAVIADASSGLDTAALKEHITAILASDSNSSSRDYPVS